MHTKGLFGLYGRAYTTNTSSINNGSINAGGISGSNSGTISESYHKGNININTNYVAGDYALSIIGGITGYNLSGTITSTYSLTDIYAVSTNVVNNFEIGGVVG